jgi:hypothetical protein
MGMGHGPAAPSPRPSTTATHSASAWQSPVPYLFGGLAAMLGLIALSLLALACSYWKLSGSILAAGEPDDDDLERRAAGAGAGDGKAAAAGKADAGERWREHVVVIMAGDERPTFLATPASGRGAPDDARGVAVVSVGCGGGGSGSGPGSEDGEEERCVECGARSWPARVADDEPSRSELSGGSGSGSSVISER